MAEDQGKHRRELERQLTDAGIEEMRAKFSEARWGQLFALLLALSFVIGGVIAIVEGHGAAGSVVAAVGGGVGIPPIIRAFMRGKVPEGPPAKSADQRKPNIRNRNKKQ